MKAVRLATDFSKDLNENLVHSRGSSKKCSEPMTKERHDIPRRNLQENGIRDVGGGLLHVTSADVGIV